MRSIGPIREVPKKNGQGRIQATGKNIEPHIQSMSPAIVGGRRGGIGND